MTNIEQQLHAEIKIINRTLAAFGVDAGTRPASTLIAGNSYIIYGLSTGAAQRISDVQRLLPELSERLSALRRRATPVRLREMPLGLEVSHPDPKPLDWRAAPLRIGSHRMLVGRSYSAAADNAIINLENRPHMLIAGTTGSGKSTMLRTALCSLCYSTPPESLRLILVDLKNEDLIPFAALPHVTASAWTADSARTVVQQVASELRRRVEQGVTDSARIVLVIDELAQIDADSLDSLSSILAVGRSKRINVVAATQHPTVRLIGDKSNYAVRIVGQVADAATAALATGRKGTGAELLPGAGAFLLVDGAQLDRLQAYYLDGESASAIVTAIAGKWGASPTDSLLLPSVDPSTVAPVAVEPVEDEVERIAQMIKHLWESSASKNAMCKHVFSRPYAGSYAAKIDRAIRRLESSTTTATERRFAIACQTEQPTIDGSSRTPAPILKIAAKAR